MKKKLITIFVLTGGLLLTIAQIVSAETGLEKSKANAANMAGSGIINGPIEKLVGAVIGVAVGLVAVLFIVMIIRAGISWMLSRDDSAKIAHAKAVIMAAAIGLILTIGAYAIVSFIITEINKKTTQNNPSIDTSQDTKNLTSEKENNQNKDSLVDPKDQEQSDCLQDCTESGTNTYECQKICGTADTQTSCTADCIATGGTVDYCSHYCTGGNFDTESCVEDCKETGYSGTACQSYCTDTSFDEEKLCLSDGHTSEYCRANYSTNPPPISAASQTCFDSCINTKSAVYCNTYCSCVASYKPETECKKKAEEKNKN